MKWQDISTAPKDGTWIIVRAVENGEAYEPEVVCWHDGYWMEARHYIVGRVDYYGWNVTQWTPLPDPTTGDAS